MRKVNRLLSLFLAASLLTYTGCKEKETPVPTENTARVDQLRNELKDLQQELLGNEVTNAYLTMTQEKLEAELERLKNEKDRKITYTVYATDLQGVFLAGAKVSIVVAGQVVTKDTDSEGKAVFANVRSGMINGVVKHNEFTTANYTASIAFGNDFVSTKVPMLPLSGDARSFTVEGKLYADLSDADDNLNYLGNVNNIQGTSVNINVAAGPDGGSTKYDGQARKITVVPVLNSVPYTPGFGNAGNIQNIAYENAIYETTSAGDGSFTLKLPILVDANGQSLDAFNGYTISFEEFSAPKTFLSSGNSSNPSYANTPNNLYANRATSTTDLPATTTGFIKLKSYTEDRIFRVESSYLEDMVDDDIYSLHMGEKTKLKVFYSEYKN